MEVSRSALAAMTLAAALLTGFGAWQFHDVAWSGDGHDTGHSDEVRLDPSIVERLQSEYGGRIKEVEREQVGGRALLEIELVDAKGREWEIYIDPSSGEQAR